MTATLHPSCDWVEFLEREPSRGAIGVPGCTPGRCAICKAQSVWDRSQERLIHDPNSLHTGSSCFLKMKSVEYIVENFAFCGNFVAPFIMCIFSALLAAISSNVYIIASFYYKI